MAEQQFTEEELATEEWRTIPKCRGTYSVSNLGRVRRNTGGFKNYSKIRILNLSPNEKGYLRVQLTCKGKRQTFRVNRLVGLLFIGPCPAGKETNHKDKCKPNNRAANLEYVTHVENVWHSIEQVRASHARGENHWAYLRPGHRPAAKLSEQDVMSIRARYKQGMGPALAKEFGICREHLYRIASGKFWSHLSLDPPV